MYMTTGLAAAPSVPFVNPALRRPLVVPKVLFLRSRVPRGFRGFGDAASILAQEQAFSTNPYLTSPAFLAGQAKALQNECAVDPSSPACIVAQTTGDISQGYNPTVDATLNLNNYCQQNVFNNQTFGDPLDTASCSGVTPKAALVAQAATIGSAFQNPLLAPGGGALPAAPAAPTAAPTGATLVNSSRSGQPFQVGDNFRLVITGSPNQPVTGSATQNGVSSGTQSYGTTDATGQKVLTGTMDASTVGNWNEVWKVGAGVAANISFSVSQPGAPPSGGSGGGTGPGSGAGGGGGNNTPPAPPASTPGLDLSFLTQTVSLFGFNVPVWALGAAGVGAVVVFSSMGRR
jgi:hypothetical protein